MVIVEPIFFTTALSFRNWLEENHDKKKEVIVGYYKLSSGKESITWSESVDQALCFGWIDGIRKSIDNIRYCIRFTPRKKNSIWSKININKVTKLTKKGLMKPEGIAIFNSRVKDRTSVYSHEQKNLNFPEEFSNLLAQNISAFYFFQNLAPSYKKLSIHWVTTAKKYPTQLKRLQLLISAFSNNSNIWINRKK